MVSVAISRQAVPAGRSQQHVLQARVIIKSKARSASVLRLALRRMYHSSFSISTHLFELFMKGLVLNRGFAGVRFALWYRLGCISRYSVWVVLLGLYLPVAAGRIRRESRAEPPSSRLRAHLGAGCGRCYSVRRHKTVGADRHLHSA